MTEPTSSRRPSSDPDDGETTDDGRLFRVARGVTAISVLGLALVVLGVGVVAFLAELAKTWTWYFRMEQAMALAAPVTVVLLAVALVGCLGLVLSLNRA